MIWEELFVTPPMGQPSTTREARQLRAPVIQAKGGARRYTHTHTHDIKNAPAPRGARLAPPHGTKQKRRGENAKKNKQR